MLGNRELSPMLQLGAVHAQLIHLRLIKDSSERESRVKENRGLSILGSASRERGERRECQILQKPTIPGLEPLIVITHNMLRNILKKQLCDYHVKETFGQAGNSRCTHSDMPPCRQKASGNRNRDRPARRACSV